MTHDHFADLRITSEDDFESALRELVQKAVLENVDVSGTWEFATRGSTHNWEVEIVELDKSFDDEEV